ncbi:MAG: signal peptide peptidase SppA [Vibrio sp.]
MKKIFRYIGLFFKGIWHAVTFLRMAVFNLLFLLLLAAFAIGFYLDGQEETMPITAQKEALVLNINGPIVEQAKPIDPLSSISESVAGAEPVRQHVLYQVVETIRHAANDDNIEGLVLKLGNMPETNLTKLKYISKALVEFKKTGKPIYAAGDFYNQSQYYLASYADKIFMSPDGGVLLKGYQAYSLYYKELLDKLDISTHIFRVGTYKSAVEPFMRNDMSDAARESALTWVNQLWDAYVTDVAKNRGIQPQALKPNEQELLALFEKHQGNLAAVAKELGLVDTLATRQQINQSLIETFGANQKGELKAISYQNYRTLNMPETLSHTGNIAVVVASGAILDGQQPVGLVGGDSTSALLKQARLDDSIKAVVLRVDSPGGSAFASEVIRNEIQALQQAGKPVVVSMSSLAASGGYWISMNADKIIAQPTTLTGSIGIFGVITTAENALDKIGVHTDGVGSSPFSKDGLTTGLSEGAQKAMQLGIEHGYQRFITLVAKGRNMTPEQVDQIAQGRVWTGRDALNNGLVDALGDFDTAVETAAKLAKLDHHQLNWIEKERSTTEQLVQELFGSMDAYLNVSTQQRLFSLLPKSLQQAGLQVMTDTNLLQLNDPKGYYTLCLPCQVQ